MAFSLLSFQALSFMLLFCYTIHVEGQSIPTNTTDFSCPSLNSSQYCDTYVIYRAQPLEYMDLGRISDLFGVSRLSIRRAGNLVSEKDALLPNQLLLVPISCGCTNNQFTANISHQIKKGDSFYLVSIHEFENLTDYQIVEAMNPTLDPTNLKIGTEVVFPLYCKCPTKTHLEKGIKFLITYVWQERDSLRQVSRILDASVAQVITENNYRNFSDSVYKPILIPVAELPLASQPSHQNPHARKKPALHIIVIGVGALLGLCFLLLLVFSYFKCYRRKPVNVTESRLESIDLLRVKKESKDEILSPRTMQEKLLPSVSGYLSKPVVYEAKTIMEATMNLSERYRISGSVYRVNIKGEYFAAKQRKGDVTEELKILQKVSHANLVKLTGFTNDAEGINFLVYEFAENGSLDKWLHPKLSSSSNSVTFLSWRQRLSVALDVANGLQYLHEHTRPSIVHGKIRTSHILLNSQFKARIANFSVSKPAADSLTPKVDVYAFGIILLELLSGRKAIETCDGGEVKMLWRELRMVLECEDKRVERLSGWMDQNLNGFYPMEGALSLAAMARACTWDKPSERPSMVEIVFSLSVLAHPCAEPFDKSFNSGVEDESIQIMSPIRPR